MNDALLQEMKILNKFYDFIRKHKDECVLEIMQEFCENEGIVYEQLGLIVAEDIYLKEYIESNLIKFKFLKNENKRFVDDF